MVPTAREWYETHATKGNQEESEEGGGRRSRRRRNTRRRRDELRLHVTSLSLTKRPTDGILGIP